MFRKSFWSVFVLGIVSVCLLAAVRPMQAQAKNTVIVIDPGHGGTNMGAQYNGVTEKNITFQVASAMYQELSQFEGVTVYMTRTADTDLSLQQRADFAKSVGADFLFCIHFNASNSHRLYGSEVWVSAFDKYYAKGASFGILEENELSALGIYSRGVKTKLNDAGTADYYGIINSCRKAGIPSAIIEHCHIDNLRDSAFYSNAAAYTAL